ncbi:DUF4157 domain-containing protein [Trichocoleus sp. FACHB-591]|uniref:eCIS core domain-containing protein n=1 Tax=Trichocoleus sp. FACHB-591 TaxID=2692872 RepID=UPI00168405AC|nr:DUF4157 domain-containing protein [Trichocoleus sp. FACHB-591]MBD2094078.1 DUF4157 domain-containing protein [Trichocoleus sp. FACHB-591]
MIGASKDKYEQEADRLAQQVVQHLSTPHLDQSLSNQALQQKSGSNGGNLQMKPKTQLQLGQDAMVASPELEASIQSTRGSGQPLDKTIRASMEQAFGGVDFRGVRIHTSDHADASNRSIKARAFTTGKDIFFRRGEYNPSSTEGLKLLAHELTHTIQQGTGGFQPQLIQRAIGFEFEFGTWKTQHDDENQSRLAKGEKIIEGPGYKIEGEYADDSTSAIEVVTKPYATKDEALVSVEDARKKLVDMVTVHEQYNEPLSAADFGGDSNINIIPGAPIGKMQASPSVSLDKIPELYRHGVGTSYQGYVSKFISEMNDQDFKEKFLNQATPSEELVGLVMLLVSYLEQGSRKQALFYPKSAFTIMARTSFTKMFQLVPEHEFFSARRNLDKWVNMVLTIAQKMLPSFQRKETGEFKRNWNVGKGFGSYQLDAKDKLIPVTKARSLKELRKEAVLGMPLMEIDPLSGDPEKQQYKLNVTRDQWLRDLPYQDWLSKGTDKRFEGMGAYGESTDIEVLEDEAEHATESLVDELNLDSLHADQPKKAQPKEAPIFELRGLRDMFGIDQDVNLDNWAEKVTAVFKVIDNTNQATYKPGGKPQIPQDVDNPDIWDKV